MLESVENDRAVRISSIKNEGVSAILQQPQDSIISVLLSGDVGFYSAAKLFAAASVNPVAGEAGTDLTRLSAVFLRKD